MPLTPATGAAPYCAAADVVALYDARVVAGLCGDDGVPVDPADLPTNPAMLLACRSASGELEAACGLGGRYAPADLAALPPGSNGAALLARVAASLAYDALRRRRGMPEADQPEALWARGLLADLGAGKAVLPFLEVAAASLPAQSGYTPPERLALDLPSDQAARLFGRRGRRGGAGHCF